jgi:hypothetical protein
MICIKVQIISVGLPVSELRVRFYMLYVNRKNQINCLRLKCVCLLISSCLVCVNCCTHYLCCGVAQFASFAYSGETVIFTVSSVFIYLMFWFRRFRKSSYILSFFGIFVNFDICVVRNDVWLRLMLLLTRKASDCNNLGWICSRCYKNL